MEDYYRNLACDGCYLTFVLFYRHKLGSILSAERSREQLCYMNALRSGNRSVIYQGGTRRDLRIVSYPLNRMS